MWSGNSVTTYQNGKINYDNNNNSLNNKITSNKLDLNFLKEQQNCNSNENKAIRENNQIFEYDPISQLRYNGIY